jgi:hypothetical protein
MPQTELFLIFLRLFNRGGFRYVTYASFPADVSVWELMLRA